MRYYVTVFQPLSLYFKPNFSATSYGSRDAISYSTLNFKQKEKQNNTKNSVCRTISLLSPSHFALRVYAVKAFNNVVAKQQYLLLRSLWDKINTRFAFQAELSPWEGEREKEELSLSFVLDDEHSLHLQSTSNSGHSDSLAAFQLNKWITIHTKVRSSIELEFTRETVRPIHTHRAMIDWICVWERERERKGDGRVREKWRQLK